MFIVSLFCFSCFVSVFSVFFRLTMFSVVQVEGENTVVNDVLDVRPLEKHRKYKFEAEDPAIYSDDDDFAEDPDLRREWPDVKLPQSVPIPDVSKDRALIVEKALESHHFNARLLESFNVNACKAYKMSKATTILQGVGKDDRDCSICGKKAFGTAHTLRSHIKSVHIKITDHQCGTCGKYFAEKSGLKVHSRIHNPTQQFKCERCPKTFDSKGHLREHFQSHKPAEERNTTCKNCGKFYAHRRGYKAHLEVCGVPPAERERFKCDECPKDYANKRDLRKHEKNVHKK